MSYFKAKMHQIRFRLGSAPDPAGGAYSAPPCWISGVLLLRGGRERGIGREGDRREGSTGREKGGKGERGGGGEDERGFPLSEILNTPLA